MRELFITLSTKERGREYLECGSVCFYVAREYLERGIEYLECGSAYFYVAREYLERAKEYLECGSVFIYDAREYLERGREYLERAMTPNRLKGKFFNIHSHFVQKNFKCLNLKEYYF